MISVIIPTYKEPDYLHLCLKSIYATQCEENEIIVVVDGAEDEAVHAANMQVIDFWKNEPGFKYLLFPENRGLQHATNFGVYNATCDRVLIVNDDNVFPKNWDKILGIDIGDKYVMSPNQIEPVPSIFRDFIIKDFGRNWQEFDLDRFIEEEQKLRPIGGTNYFKTSGSTLPIYIEKKLFMMVGGWDADYPSAHVCDWDFFLKLELADAQLLRTTSLNFYHFGGKATKDNDSHADDTINLGEQLGHEYFEYKWGFRASLDSDNKKSPHQMHINGIRYK